MYTHMRRKGPNVCFVNFYPRKSETPGTYLELADTKAAKANRIPSIRLKDFTAIHLE